jgi:hypothetical protein
MSTQTIPSHRVSAGVAQMRGIADSLVDASVWSMEPLEAGATLVELVRLQAQVVELTARVAAHADRVGVGDDEAATSTGAWLAAQTRLTRAEAHRTVGLGRDLDTHPLTRDALAAGRINPDQARVIIGAVDDLPDDLPPALVEQAEQYLVTAAAEHDAKALGVLGRHLLEVVAAEEADAREAAALEDEERRAAQACRFTMRDDGHGQAHGRFTLPSFHAAALAKMLHALAAPKHHAATGGRANPDEAPPKPTQKPTPQQMGEAFCELIESLSGRDLPQTGGTNATLVVLIDQQVLTGQLEKAGLLDTGGKISPTLARRLACQARILPAVMGGQSQPLDLGRTRRLYTTTQRIAMFIRDGGCAAQGCDRVTGLHAHHKQPWASGGATNLTDGISLCHWHHNRAHDNRYTTTYHADGTITFHRRT